MISARWLAGVAVAVVSGVAAGETPRRPVPAPSSVVKARLEVRQSGGSCEDVARLERLMAAAEGPAREIYRSAVRERSEAGLGGALRRAADLGRFSRGWWVVGDLEDGAHSDAPDPTAEFARVRADLGAARCFDPERVDAALAVVDELEPMMSAYRAEEIKCRKAPACRARRVAIRHAAAACGLVDQERAILESIRLERANPAGVVSLSTLHGLGDALRATREELGIARAEFAKLTKQRFSAEICKDVPVDPVSGEYLSGPVTVELEVEPSAP